MGAEVVLAFQLETTAQIQSRAWSPATALALVRRERVRMSSSSISFCGRDFFHVVRQGEPHGPQLPLELRQVRPGRGAEFECGTQLQRLGVALGNLLVLLTGGVGRQLGGFELLFESLAHLEALPSRSCAS